MKFLFNGLILSLLLLHAPLKAQFSVIIQIDHPVSCNGGSDAALSAVVSPAGSTYTYTWSNGATTPGLSDVPAGAYAVTVQNAAGGFAIASAVLSEPAPLELTAITDLPAPANPTGSVEVETGGGTLPYAFEWKNALNIPFSNEEDLLDAPAGAYTLNAVDANGCTAVLSPVTLVQTTAIQESEAVIPEIFPNPVASTLSIRTPNGAPARVLIFSPEGALFLSQSLKNSDTLEIQHWPSGIYTLYFPELGASRQVMVTH